MTLTNKLVTNGEPLCAGAAGATSSIGGILHKESLELKKSARCFEVVIYKVRVEELTPLLLTFISVGGKTAIPFFSISIYNKNLSFPVIA